MVRNCLIHLTCIYIPRATHNLILADIHWNFFLLYTQPNSLTSLHNFSSESATRAPSSENNNWFISNVSLFSCSWSSPFPSIFAFTSRPTPSIYKWNKHGYIQSTLPQSNINRKPLTRIYSYLDMPYYLHKYFALLSTIFLQLQILSASATYLVNQLYYSTPFPNT